MNVPEWAEAHCDGNTSGRPFEARKHTVGSLGAKIEDPARRLENNRGFVTGGGVL